MDNLNEKEPQNVYQFFESKTISENAKINGLVYLMNGKPLRNEGKEKKYPSNIYDFMESKDIPDDEKVNMLVLRMGGTPRRQVA